MQVSGRRGPGMPTRSLAKVGSEEGIVEPLVLSSKCGHQQANELQPLQPKHRSSCYFMKIFLYFVFLLSLFEATLGGSVSILLLPGGPPFLLLPPLIAAASLLELLVLVDFLSFGKHLHFQSSIAGVSQQCSAHKGVPRVSPPPRAPPFRLTILIVFSS